MSVRTISIVVALALSVLVACQSGSSTSQAEDVSPGDISAQAEGLSSDAFASRYGGTAGSDQFAPPIEQFNESAELGDLVSAVEHAGEVYEDADDELVRLDANPPQPCLAGAHAAVRAYVVKLRDGSAVALGGDSGDAEAVAEGVRRLGEADFLLQDAHRLIDIIDC